MSQSTMRIGLVVGGALLFAAGFAGGRMGGHAAGTGDRLGEIMTLLRDARHECAGSATAGCYTDVGGGDRDKLVACLSERVGQCEERFVRARAQAIAGYPPGANTAAR